MHKGSQAPSEWVVRHMALFQPGIDVLDLACGSGRHTALFCDNGFRVTALDRDITQLGTLAERHEVEALQFDLEAGLGWPFAQRRFGAIVVANYLHRPLFPQLVSSLGPGGVLIYETFAAGNEAFGKPSNPDFLLKPGELLNAVAGALSVVSYEHGVQDSPRKAVVQRICAINNAEPVRLPPR